MRNSLKRKLSLLLAIALVFTMALPTGLLASAAEGDGEPGAEEPVIQPVAALEEDVTDKVDTASIASARALRTFSTTCRTPSSAAWLRLPPLLRWSLPGI